MKLFQFLKILNILAAVAIISALGLSIFMDSAVNAIDPVLVFLPSIALLAWIGGYKPGILATIVASAILDYLFLPPIRSFIPTDPITMIKLLLFFSEGILLSLIIDNGKRSPTIADYRRREKELKEKIGELEQQCAASNKEIKSRDEFLSIASHELKTPLTSMLLQTQTALHNIKNVSLAHFSIENLLKMLESVENQTKRLSKMINDLLNISLITTGNLQLVPEQVDLEIVMSDVLDDFSARIQRENYEIIYTEHVSVVGQWDKIRIEQAISNLISNAIKYGKRKPIEIVIGKEKNFASVSVTDHGIGIPKEQQEKIFGLFERAVSPTEYKGLGVGLYITNQIIKAHGGTISVSSKVSQVTTFTVKLPIN